jgi:hypothetical protein
LITALLAGRVVIRATSTVDPGKTDSIVVHIAGAQATDQLFNATRGRMALALDGNAGNVEGQIFTAGSLADEWMNSETFPTRSEYDRRQINTVNITLLQVFTNLQLTYYTARWLESELRRFSPNLATDSRFTTAHLIQGSVFLHAAMNYCSGVPFLDFAALDVSAWGSQLTTAQMLSAAIARFDSVLASAPGVGLHDIARLLKARALVLQGQFAAAAGLVGALATGGRGNSGHPTGDNGIFFFNRSFKRFSIAHGKGGNGLGFRGAAGTNPAQADPRVTWVAQGLGFDGMTQSYGWLAINAATDPVPFVKGEEARLIEAEAALQTGNIATFIAIINSLRAPAGLPPVVDPGGAARVDLLFAERGFWLFGTGTRLSDLRRLIRQYGRAENTVFPTGPYPKGGVYGTDVNFPLPSGQINPSIPTVPGSCFDRNA